MKPKTFKWIWINSKTNCIKRSQIKLPLLLLLAMKLKIIKTLTPSYSTNNSNQFANKKSAMKNY